MKNEKERKILIKRMGKRERAEVELFKIKFVQMFEI